jgi:hypothetical protein
MHTNPLNDFPPSHTVDRLLGKSYEVVKTVYMNIPILKEVHDSDAIKYIYSNIDFLNKIESQSKDIANISNNIEDLLALPQLKVKLENATNAGKQQIQDKADSVTSEISQYTDKSISSVQEELNKGMFSYRYLNDKFESETFRHSVQDVLPSENLKVGDHVVTITGTVHEVTLVGTKYLTIGKALCTLKGEQGLPGTGLILSGVYDTSEEFFEAHPYGTHGSAYEVLNNLGSGQPTVYIWSSETLSWQDAGALKGAKGDKGDKGDRGEVGPKGDKGDAPDLTVYYTKNDCNDLFVTNSDLKTALEELIVEYGGTVPKD